MALFPLRRLLWLLLTLLPLTATMAGAQTLQSGWAASSRSSVRMIVGEISGGEIAAGVEIKLAPGYKTYWRSPGDSGIPPRFDWSASDNLATAEVSWPLPVRFSDGAGQSIGYTSDVILPVRLRATDPTKPVRLVLKLDYAVCEKICIPAQGTVTLALPARGTDPQQLARLDKARQSVPQPIDMTRDGRGPRLAGASWRGFSSASEPDAAIIALDCFADNLLDVFVEGPDMWAFGAPVRTASAGERLSLAIPVLDRPKQAQGRQRFTVTLVAPDKAVEVQLDLDIPQTRP